MKKTFSILLTAIITGFALVAHSTVLRVNNTPAIVVPYATLQDAYNAAANGDTIYLEGSEYNYGTIDIYKRLVIIGTGYFLNENPETQANINPSSISSVNYYTGSSGSKLTGLSITSSLYFSSTNLQDFVFIRNFLNSVNSSYPVSNFLVEQNFIPYGLNGQFENSTIRNNYVGYFGASSINNTLAVYNNVMDISTTSTKALCYNNVLIGYANFTNCTLFNNVCSETQVPAGNGNQLNVDMNDVFVCYTTCTGYSADARYHLKTGSPAIGAGSSGEDCGMFGGSNPYLLSGLPAIPAIYNFNYNFNNATINVDMKVKSHN
jgi:hypothetical protein